MFGELLEVGVIGKSVGLGGGVKIHNRSDFLAQFRAGAEFLLKNGEKLVLKSFNRERMTGIFVGYESVEEVKNLTNLTLYRTKEATRRDCKLKKGEFFWFDILGCEVFEDGEKLGEVSDILESGAGFLLGVSVASGLCGEGDSAGVFGVSGVSSNEACGFGGVDSSDSTFVSESVASDCFVSDNVDSSLLAGKTESGKGGKSGDKVAKKVAKVAKVAKKDKLPNFFYIPYHDNFIISVSTENKRILTKNARLIFENS